MSYFCCSLFNSFLLIIMKKLSILSLMCAVALSFFLLSCGAKRDEALVTDFNAKKTQADSLMKMMDNSGKMMMTDHAAWGAKLDDAAKGGADTAKIADFKAQMKKMEDMSKANAAMDSMHAYMNAKTETNDQLRAAIAGLDAQISMCNTMCNGMMDAHKKLGADITAFLGGAAPASTPAKEEPKGGKKADVKSDAPTTATPGSPAMDASKHPVKTVPGGRQRNAAGSTIKQ
jgi:hypothetical protein